MKVQLILLSLFVSIALALPVPDEEVSPVKPAPVGEIKSELTDEKQVVKQPAVDVAVKPEARASEDQEKQPLNTETKLEGDKLAAKPALNEEKPTLLLGTPDAELAQSLPEQKPELKEKEKNLRADNQVAETKALPAGIVETAVVPSAVEEQKQIVEEDKPSVQDIQPAGKSADLTAAPATVAEEKEAKIPEASGDSIANAVPITTEVKPEESPARQERGNEQKGEVSGASSGSEQINAELPAAAEESSNAGAAAESPAIKTLKEEQPEKQAEQSAPASAAAAPAPELKSAALEPEKQATTGDISKQSSEESNIKSLPNEVSSDAKLPSETAAAPSAEGKKIEETPAPLALPSSSSSAASADSGPSAVATQPAEQLAQQQKEIPAQASEIQPLKKIEEQKDSSEERKDSAESKESAESDELKTKSDESKDQSDEKKSN